jgi:urease accessory protein
MHRETTALTIVRQTLHHTHRSGRAIPIVADRWQLAKTRWRATAADGREFGFELEYPLRHGDVILENDYGHYVLEQSPESVLVFTMGDIETTASLAWSIGNLHQPLQVLPGELVAADDPALRQWCDQQHVTCRVEFRVFQPLRTAAGHHHHHHH